MLDPRPARRRVERWLAVLLVVQLGVGLTATVRLQAGVEAPARSATQASTQQAPVRPDVRSRTAQVQALLSARADAVLQQDRAAFLATVDPTRTGFRSRQARLIEALRDVPVAIWSYELDPADTRPPDLALDRQRGTWWAPSVTLRYSLAGFDREPTAQQQWLTFVQRGDRWYVAADDDFAAGGHATARDLWDGGPVLVFRGASCLVLAHPGGARRARSVVAECDTAVQRVRAVWGRSWTQRVVMLLPDSTAELASVVPDAGDLSQIAAVATAELLDPDSGYHPVGDRVVVNPVTFSQLGPLGRGVVLAHEVTHVASRAATGPQVPTWLVEGLADYVGYLDVDIPLSVSASELRADVREGRLPSALPVDADFEGSRDDLAQIYEQSWLAVVLLARTYGQAVVLELYRSVGADKRPGALERAFRTRLGSTLPAFSGAWCSDLKRRLA